MANRALESMYPVVFFDALRVKIRDEGSVRNKAVYLALGIQRDGTKDVLGLWIQQSEGAKFWLAVMNELKNRGLQDILIAVIDGLKGFPEAITAVFPDIEIQTCIVHLIRNSLSFSNWKPRQPVARELKQIYEAETAELAAKQFLARISQVEACLGQRRQSPFSIGWPNKIRAMTGNASFDRGRKHSSDPPARNIRVV